MNRPVRLLGGPEIHVALFGLLLNFPWEMWQAPLYAGMADASHFSALVRCSIATLGDAAILVVGYIGVAALAQRRCWVLDPSWRERALFVAAGLGSAVLLELAATAIDVPAWSWRYGSSMPTLIGVGLLPIAQWTLIPIATLWFVRRQLS